MSQAFGAPQKRRKPTINITSLIDVMFLLLIFFMVSSTFKQEEETIDITLPQAGTATAQALDFHEVLVDTQGVFYVDGERVEPTALEKHLKGIVSEDSEARIVLRADAGADWQAIVQVMDIARAVGVRNLVIPTDRLEELPTSP
mgnify:CR=1 FL=1